MSKMMTCQVLMIDRDGNAIDVTESMARANTFQAVLNQLFSGKPQENDIFTT